MDPNLDEGMGEGSEARVRRCNAVGPGSVPAERKKF
jgi:hypothetical protein